jgi:hypothetical protein
VEATIVWRLATASAIGTSHAGSGTPCQDSRAHKLLCESSGCVLVAVVCDGAGSAAHSDVGSALAADLLVELLESHLELGGSVAQLTRELAADWLDCIAKAIERRAHDQGHLARDYACTLLAAIVGEKHAAFIQVGDGAIVVSHGPADGWSYVFWPQHGEFANTTNFLISPNLCEVLEFEVAPRSIDEFAIFSDGIEKLVLHDATRTVHQTFFDAMFPPVRALGQGGEDATLSAKLESYLSSDAVCQRTDDDKTLILATRNPSASEQSNG